MSAEAIRKAAKSETGNSGERVPFPQSTASVLLDLLRGLAALVVLLDHWRNAFFADFHDLPSRKAFALLPYVLSSGGHQAVVVFFVLSGYLIGGSLFRALEQERWSWSDYLMHRLVRLWIVLLPGLLLCEVWDRLGIFLGRAPLLYGGANYNHMTPSVLPRLGSRVFWGNAFFLGGLHVPNLGSDGALWSLAIEFWYYILFPALFLLLWERRWRTRCVLLAVAAGVCWLTGPGILYGFPIWLFGAALAATKRLPVLRPWVGWVVLAAYVVIFFGMAKVNFASGLIADDVLGACTAVLLVCLLSARHRADEQRLFVRVSRRLASFSFTLYVAHLPLLLLLVSLVQGDRRRVPTLQNLGEGAVVLLLILAYSWALASLTEFRTAAVRRWLERQVLRRLPFGRWAAQGAHR